MSNQRKSKSETILNYMFKNEETVMVPLTEKQLETKRRYESIYAFWLKNPSITDSRMRDWIMRSFHRTEFEANHDIGTLKPALNHKGSQRSWTQYIVEQGLLRAAELAEKNLDYVGMVNAYDKLAKYTQLDKPIDELPFKDFSPPALEATGDLQVLSDKLVPYSREQIERMKAKYGMQSAEEVPFTEDQSNE